MDVYETRALEIIAHLKDLEERADPRPVAVIFVPIMEVNWLRTALRERGYRLVQKNWRMGFEGMMVTCAVNKIRWVRDHRGYPRLLSPEEPIPPAPPRIRR
jgi:hypothetical protein